MSLRRRGKDKKLGAPARCRKDTHVSFTLDHPGQDFTDTGSLSPETGPAPNKLQLRISHMEEIDGIPLVWEDKTRAPIERKIKDIVVRLIVTGEAQRRRGEASRHDWLIKRKAELIEEARDRKAEKERQERERQIKAEEARINRFLGEAATFRQANDIRAYV